MFEMKLVCKPCAGKPQARFDEGAEVKVRLSPRSTLPPSAVYKKNLSLCSLSLCGKKEKEKLTEKVSLSIPGEFISTNLLMRLSMT